MGNGLLAKEEPKVLHIYIYIVAKQCCFSTSHVTFFWDRSKLFMPFITTSNSLKCLSNDTLQLSPKKSNQIKSN